MFNWIATLVTRRGWLVIAAWLLLTSVLVWFAPSWKSISRDDDLRFFPPEYKSVIGRELLDRGFPSDASSSTIVLVMERLRGKLTAEDWTFVRQISGAISDYAAKRPELQIKDNILNAETSPVLKDRLTAPSLDKEMGGEATLIIIPLEATHLSKRARETVDQLHSMLLPLRADAPVGLTFHLTGSAVVGHDLNEAAKDSIDHTTVATVILVIVILLLVYRAPLLAILPLLTIALSVFVSIKAIAALTLVPGLNFQVINITEIFVVVVLFGAGTDYCLFLISRYREELNAGLPHDEAIREAIVKVGGALAASAGTVIVGLGLLWFSSFAKISNTGPAIALSLAIALAATLTIAPVALHYLRGVVFWPEKLKPRSRPSSPSPSSERNGDSHSAVNGSGNHHAPASPASGGSSGDRMSGLWHRIADLVVRRPALILSLSVAGLLPFAIMGANTHSNYSQLADLEAEHWSVRGAIAIQRYFAVGELSPATVIIEHPSLDFKSDAGRKAIQAVSKELSTLPSIAETRSLTQPLGADLPPAAPPKRRPPLFHSLRDNLSQGVTQGSTRVWLENRYVRTEFPESGDDLSQITRFELIFTVDPFSEESLHVLEGIHRVIERAVSPEGVLAGATKWGLSGATADIEDLREVTLADQYQMYWLVTLGVYLILVVLLRRPWICLYLMATVVLGYLAALGITELVFREFLWDRPEPWDGQDWKVGFFLFVILVAVGEDYNIFLMSRVAEEQKEHGPIEGVRLAVAHTGGIISSCGLIMAGTFGAMLVGQLMALKQLGFALAVGVLLDTFVVRPVLVPAFIVLTERARARMQRRPESPSLTANLNTNINTNSADPDPAPRPQESEVTESKAPIGQMT